LLALTISKKKNQKLLTKRLGNNNNNNNKKQQNLFKLSLQITYHRIFEGKKIRRFEKAEEEDGRTENSINHVMIKIVLKLLSHFRIDKEI
jgi:hypothetical protein